MLIACLAPICQSTQAGLQGFRRGSGRGSFGFGIGIASGRLLGDIVTRRLSFAVESLILFTFNFISGSPGGDPGLEWWCWF